MMKKIFLNIYLFFAELFRGMRNADNIIMAANNDQVDNNGGGIETKKQARNVWEALLNREVTQEVAEMRHNMYQVERKAKRYSVDKDTLQTNYSEDNFKKITGVENSDGNTPIYLINNKPNDKFRHPIDTLTYKGEVVSNAVEDNTEMFIIERDFIPKYKWENYFTKLVVKKCEDDTFIFDFYFPIEGIQFDRISRQLTNEIKRVYEGNRQSDLLEFNTIEFTTYNARGIDDFITLKYGGFEYITTTIYNSEYVMKFKSNVKISEYDMVNEEYFNEEAQRKYDEKAPREGGTEIDLEYAMYKEREAIESQNVTKEEELSSLGVI